MTSHSVPLTNHTNFQPTCIESARNRWWNEDDEDSMKEKV